MAKTEEQPKPTPQAPASDPNPPPVPPGQYDPLLDSIDTRGTLPESVKDRSKR